MQSPFEQVKKLAKNHANFKEIIRKAPGDTKVKYNLTEMDENKMTRAQFQKVLDYISQQAEITPPTKEEKYQIFVEFNPNKDEFISKEQYEKVSQRISEMLNTTQNI